MTRRNCFSREGECISLVKTGKGFLHEVYLHARRACSPTWPTCASRLPAHSRCPVPFYRVELHTHCQGDPDRSRYIRHTIFEHVDTCQAKSGLECHRGYLASRKFSRILKAESPMPAIAASFFFAGMEAETGSQAISLVLGNVEPGDLPGRDDLGGGANPPRTQAQRARHRAASLLSPPRLPREQQY